MTTYAIDLYSDIYAAPITPKSIRFRATLTGAEVGLPDIELQLKNYSGTHYSGQTSYMSYILPYSIEYMTAITNRPNGEMILTRYADSGNGIIETGITRGTLQTSDYTKGALSSSINLQASRQTTNTTLRTYTLSNIINIDTDSDGKKIFSVSGYIDIQAGDYFEYEDETLTADKISINITSSTFTYKIREQ